MLNFKASYIHEAMAETLVSPWQDYYSWKSQDALLPLSSSGHLLAETQSVMPKTFSTRTGPLLLYSQVTCRLTCWALEQLLSRSNVGDKSFHYTGIQTLIHFRKYIFFWCAFWYYEGGRWCFSPHTVCVNALAWYNDAMEVATIPFSLFSIDIISVFLTQWVKL